VDGCKNCAAVLEPEFDFCPKCGQKSKLHRLNLRDLIHDGIHFFFHADKSVLVLVRELAARNGKVAREFIEGKRKKYYPPLNFFLLVAAVYLFVQIKTDDHVHVDVMKRYPELAAIQNKKQQAMMVDAYQRREESIHFMNLHSNTIMMASLPVIALLFWVFYRRGKFNYTEHLVAGMYMFGFYTLLTALAFGFGHFVKPLENWIYLACFFIEVAYFTTFYRNFMQGGTGKAFLASLTAVILSALILFVSVWVYMFYAYI
jgi:hypothetical protein